MEACFVQSMAPVLVWPVCKAEMELGEVERSDGLLAGLLVDLESCGVQLRSACGYGNPTTACPLCKAGTEK